MKRALLAALLAWPCFHVSANPRPDVNSITLPTFVFERRHAITAGVAFLVDEGDHRLLVSAYHILGPQGGLKTRISPRDVPREVKAIAALCLGNTETVLLGAPVLLVEDAKPVDNEGADRDILLALVKDKSGPKALQLTNKPAAVGDRVWLFARILDREMPTTYPAKVTAASATALQYEMEDPALNLRALSGAPVLADDGTVVGMHLGYGKDSDRLIGAAAPAAAIRARIVAGIVAATKKPGAK